MSHVHLVPRPRPAVQRELIARHGRRFGTFAALPFPDVDDCLTQIERATEIGLDGFMHLTRNVDRPAGHPDFHEIFRELDRRQARPSSIRPTCC